MLGRLIINLVTAAVVAAVLYNILFFLVIPRLLRHYRKTSRTEVKYEKELADIEWERGVLSAPPITETNKYDDASKELQDGSKVD